MNAKKDKKRHLLLYFVIAIIVLLSLIVLPLADTDHPDSSDGNTQSMEEGALAVSGTVTGSAITVDTVTGSAINVDTVTGGAIDLDKPKKDDPEKLPKKTIYDYEDDNIIVKAVFSDAEAVPDNAELIVTPITEATDSEQYSEVEAYINDSIEADNKTVTSFLAYDIYFLADGVEYEPELGIVNVKLQYKNEILEESIKKVSDEIKVLHLKETAEGIRVEDVTQEVSLVEKDEENTISGSESVIQDVNTNSSTEERTGEAAEKDNGSGNEDGTQIEFETGNEAGNGTKSGSEVEVEAGEKAGTEKIPEIEEKAEPDLGAADTVKFVTNSFSTFVVTGITNIKPVINVTMEFVDTNGVVNTDISETYYLNITNTSNNQRYNAKLNVLNGTVQAQISGLYDQNGNAKGDGSLYFLTNADYSAVLFKHPLVCPANFKWDHNDLAKYIDCVEYEYGSEIIENYIITDFSNSIKVNSGVGTLKITATAKSGTTFSSNEILNLLSPVRPYSVFAAQFDLVADMEGSIAVQKANLGRNFGNSSNNRSKYNYSTIRTIVVKKAYNGAVKKTFKFGLFKDNVLYDTTTITLPTSEGKNTATATFAAMDATSTYSVHELTDNNTKLLVGDKYNGFTLTSISTKNNTTSSVINSISYVETILSSSPTPLRQGADNIKNALIVGSNYTVSRESNRIHLYEGNREIMTAEDAFCDISVANGNFPINFSEILSNMAVLSERLATALSTDTVMVKNMTIAELNSKNNSNGLTFQTNGRMLLINIDATGTTNISLRANAELIVNGEKCAGWSKEANNIVVNIFTKSGGKYYAYTGDIRDAGRMMGTLLVPRASVSHLGQNFNGNIVGKYVKNDAGEVHGNTIGIISLETVYEFTNIAENTIVLPLTGGIGTQLFYYLGAGIIILGIGLSILYYLIRRKKPDLSG